MKLFVILLALSGFANANEDVFGGKIESDDSCWGCEVKFEYYPNLTGTFH